MRAHYSSWSYCSLQVSNGLLCHTYRVAKQVLWKCKEQKIKRTVSLRKKTKGFVWVKLVGMENCMVEARSATAGMSHFLW